MRILSLPIARKPLNYNLIYSKNRKLSIIFIRIVINLHIIINDVTNATKSRRRNINFPLTVFLSYSEIYDEN